MTNIPGTPNRSFIKFISLIILSLSILPLHGQIQDISPFDYEIIQKFKKEYEEISTAYVKIEIEIELFTNQKTGLIESSKVVTEKIALLRKTSDYYFKNLYYDDQSKITGFRASLPNEKKIKSEFQSFKANPNGIYHSDMMGLQFRVPLYKAKDMIILEYRTVFKDLKHQTPLYFHQSTPIHELEINYIIPKNIALKIREYHTEEYQIKKRMDDNSDYVQITYQVNDLKPITKSANLDYRSLDLPHLLLEPDEKADSMIDPFYRSDADYYSWHKTLVTETQKDNSVFGTTLADLLDSCKTSDEKIANIYSWVQENIRYIAFEDGIFAFKPASAGEVFTNRYGDCKGMAVLLKEMLVSAGLDARLCWIGTRNLPYECNLRNLAANNHMITCLIREKDTLYLDATAKGANYLDIPFGIRNQDAMVENGNTFFIDTLRTTIQDKKVITSNLAINGIEISGTESRKFYGQERIYLHQWITSLPKNQIDKEVKHHLYSDQPIDIQELTISDLKDRMRPIELSYVLNNKSNLISINNELYINLNLDRSFENYQFEKEDLLSLNFGREINLDYTIQLQLPEGYQISYLPAALSEIHEEYSIRAEMQYDPIKQCILYKKLIQIPNGRISIKNSGDWNKSIQNLKKFYNDQVILSRY